MTKHLRNPVTRQFLASGSEWTKDVHKAHPVTDYFEAAALARLLGVRQAELYYSFQDRMPSSRWDFVIPLGS